MTTMDNFRMPSEPSPLPSLGSGSDEESFVVLGKSLCDVERTPPGEQPPEPSYAMSVIEETKRLISEELKVIDKKMMSMSGGSVQSQMVNPKDASVDGVNEMQNSSRSVTEKMSSASLRNITEPLQNLQIAAGNSAGSPYMSMDAKDRSVTLPQLPDISRTFEPNSAISIATFASDLTSEEVENKITQIIEENINLKDTILRNNQSLEAQYERIRGWQEEVQKVHQSHKEKIYEAKAVIDKLKKENDLKNVEIKGIIEHLDNKDKEIEILNKKMASMKVKLDEKLSERSESNLKEFDLDIAKNKIRELENELQIMNENLNIEAEKKVACEKRILELQEQLNYSKDRHEELETELAKMKYTISEREAALTIENNSLRSQLVSTTQNQANLIPSEEFSKLKQQLQVTQMNLIQTEQSRAVAYEQVQMLNRQVEALNLQSRSVDPRTNQTDEIFALQTQLELYKADFEAEHSANQVLKEEKEKYLEDLQNLQRINQQLHEQIEKLGPENNGSGIFNRRRTTDHSTSSTSPSAPNDHSFKCPKCGFGFKDLQSLQNHVYRCIEIDESLP